MKVSRLPVNPGPSGWGALLLPPPPSEPLGAPVTADFLVIGAGFAGLAAARRLGQTCPDARIVVLEALRVGEGPAGRNSGFMIDVPHHLASANYTADPASDRAEIAANRIAIDFARETAEALGLPDEALRQSGKINGAASDRGLAHTRAFARHLGTLGEDHRLLDADDMHALTGSRYYLGGVETPRSVMLQPALFVRGMAAGLVSNRIRVHEQSPVTALTRTGDTWRAETSHGAVTAPKVILAVNGHAESFGQFRGRLLHVYTYASMTRALERDEAHALGGAPDWSITPADPLGTTVRRVSGIGGDRIVVRNRFTYNPGLGVEGALPADIAQTHDRAFAARFPGLAGIDMEYRWGGALCLSRNGAPAFGEVEPGLVAACCQNGLGTTKGTLAGLAAADLAAGIDSPARTVMEMAGSPRRLPPAPLTWLGATLRLRLGERTAGVEL